MNRYSSVFSTQDPQNNRNQFESQVTKPNEPKLRTVSQSDAELVLKFLEAVSNDPVNEHKSSEEKLRIAMEIVKQLKTF